MGRWAVGLCKLSGFLTTDREMHNAFSMEIYEESKNGPPFAPPVALSARTSHGLFLCIPKTVLLSTGVASLRESHAILRTRCHCRRGYYIFLDLLLPATLVMRGAILAEFLLSYLTLVSPYTSA